MSSIKLAWRSIWRNRRRTIITLFSMAIGLCIAIFFIAMGDGVYYQLVNDAARMQAGHITVENPGYRDAPAVDLYVSHADTLRKKLDALKGVKLTKKLVAGQAVIRSGRDSIGVAVLGVEPSVEIRTSPLPRHVTKGKYLADGDASLVIIGAKLARQLQVQVGSKVVITANNTAGDLVEELFHVKGIYETGTDEVDGYMVQAPLDSIAKLFGLPAHSATQLGVVLSEPEHQDAIYEAASVAATRKDAAVLRWQDVMPDLASYIKIDKGSNIVFQAVLIIACSSANANSMCSWPWARPRACCAARWWPRPFCSAFWAAPWACSSAGSRPIITRSPDSISASS